MVCYIISSEVIDPEADSFFMHDGEKRPIIFKNPAIWSYVWPLSIMHERVG